MMFAFPWPDWFFYKVPDTLAGFLFFLVACILIIWGIALVWSAPSVKSFSWALGWFMLADCLVYSILGASVLRDPRGIDVWAHLLILFVTATAVGAFVLWAKERRDTGSIT